MILLKQNKVGATTWSLIRINQELTLSVTLATVLPCFANMNFFLGNTIYTFTNLYWIKFTDVKYEFDNHRNGMNYIVLK